MRERTGAYLALMIVAIVVAMLSSTPAAAQVHITTRDGGGGSGPSCTGCDDAPDPEECCDQKQDPIGRLPAASWPGCGPQFNEGLSSIPSCTAPDLDSTIPYDAEVILDEFDVPVGVAIEGDEIDCVGYAEALEEIGTIELSHEHSGKVARIAKFIEAPYSGPPAIGHVRAVYLELNTRSFTILTAGLSMSQLNSAMASAMATRFVIQDHGDYWIVVRERQTSASINFLSLRADDQGLVTMDVELRSADPGHDYSTLCGEE